MKLQDKLEGLASTEFERKVIRLWLREGRIRPSAARILGDSQCPARPCRNVPSRPTAAVGSTAEGAWTTVLGPVCGEAGDSSPDLKPSN